MLACVRVFVRACVCVCARARAGVCVCVCVCVCVRACACVLYALNLKNIKKTKNKKQLPLIIIIINIALNLDADPQAQAKRRYTLLFTHFIDYNFPYSLYNIMIIITIKADTCELHSVQRPEVPDNLAYSPTSPETILFSVLI